MDPQRRAVRPYMAYGPADGMASTSAAGTGAGAPGTAPAASSWVLSSRRAPVLPQTPVAPSQARYSTYASRMRAGTTTLMQPILRGGHDLDGLDRGVSTGGTARSNARGVYYGEDSDEEEEDLDSDDEEYGPGSRRKRRRSVPQSEEARSTQSPGIRGPADAEAEAEVQPPGSQLGMPVPANRIVVRAARRTEHDYFSEQQLSQQASCAEVLVPIRIEFQTDTHRIKDVFLWNVHERLMTPYRFAQSFLQDLDLPLHPYAAQIESLIIQQLTDAMSVLETDDEGTVLSRIIDLKTGAQERKRLEALAEEQRRRQAAAAAYAAGQGDGITPPPRRRGRPRKHPLPPPPPPEELDAQMARAADAARPFATDSPQPAAATEQSGDANPQAAEKARVQEALAGIDAEDDLRVIVEVRTAPRPTMLTCAVRGADPPPRAA